MLHPVLTRHQNNRPAVMHTNRAQNCQWLPQLLDGDHLFEIPQKAGFVSGSRFRLQPAPRMLISGHLPQSSLFQFIFAKIQQQGFSSVDINN